MDTSETEDRLNAPPGSRQPVRCYSVVPPLNHRIEAMPPEVGESLRLLGKHP